MADFEVAAVKQFLKRLSEHEDGDYIIRAVLDNSSVKDSHRKGQAFEDEVEMHARGLGLCVERGVGRDDLILNGWRVQCKNVDEVRNGTVCISNMRPVKQNNGLRGYRVEDVDFFAVKHRGVTGLIPVARLSQDGIVVDQRVAVDKIESHRDAWHQLTPPGSHGSGQRELF